LKGKIGLFAGDGELPVEIARRLSGEGNPPVAFSFREDTASLEECTSEVIKVGWLEIGKIVKDLETRGISSLMLAGLVPKKLIYRADLMDDDLRNIISTLSSRDDHAVLGAVVSFFESRGIRVLPYREIVPEMLAREGIIAGRRPLPEEEDDILYGLRIASFLVPMSFGQTVVIKGRSVVSVEAMEGTDAAIERAGAISRGGVVVKMMRPDQDERFDIPVIGPGTLETMHEADIGCLAVEAGRTIVLGGELFRERAEEWGIAVTGVIPAPSL